jgi:pyruvate ferredoxin oxidoreductase beta subunit
MAHRPVKFFQVGSFAAGNRLLEEDERSVQAGVERTNALTKGHRACQGCGEALGARYVLDAAMRATEGRLIAANATGCLEVFSTPYPESSWQVAWLHSLFGNAPAVASGIAAALKAKGRTDVRVIGQGGDGGTLDIGFACLSGMFERGDDVLYVCYDNEAYMNTGVQRSGATPPAARTATTKPVGAEPILVAHGSVRGTIEDVVDELRDEGHRVGALGITCFRPFPLEEIREALTGASRIVVVERAFAVGIGGIVGQNVRLALAGLPSVVYDVVAGLGGRAITRRSLRTLVEDVQERRIEPNRLHFLDLDGSLVERELQRLQEKRRSGPHAENILRDVGVVAARTH